MRVKNVAPVSIRKTVDATDYQIGQDGVATMALTGAPELVQPEIVAVYGPINKDKLDNLAFAEELVTVMVHTTNDKDSPQYVQTWNYGRHQLFIRGEPVTVKRKFVEVLARMKPVNYRNEEFVDSDGNQNVRWPKTTGLANPFSIIEDKNPLGPAWLRKILAE